MKNYRIPLEEDRFYHIYNRGNNSEQLFFTNANYEFFIRQYDNFLSDYVDTFAFCLLPNHFHLLIRVKPIKDLKVSLEKNETLLKVPHFEKAKPLRSVSAQFQKLFTSYSMAINKQEGRHGSLFEKPFRRIEVSSTQYLANLVFYIHANPQLHGLCDDFRHYPWSSYDRILKTKPSKLCKKEVIEWFDDKENYLAYHSQKADIAAIKAKHKGFTFF